MIETTYEVLDYTMSPKDDALCVSVVAVNEEGTSKDPSSNSEHDTED